MTVTQMEYISHIFMGIAIIFAIVSVLLFFVLDIKKIWKITNKRFMAATWNKDYGHLKKESVAVSENQIDNKQEQQAVIMTNEKSAGCLSTQLISGENIPTQFMTENNKMTEPEQQIHEGSEPTQLMSEHKIMCIPTEQLSDYNDSNEETMPLEASGVNLIQDITYTKI